MYPKIIVLIEEIHKRTEVRFRRIEMKGNSSSTANFRLGNIKNPFEPLRTLENQHGWNARECLRLYNIPRRHSSWRERAVIANWQKKGGEAILSAFRRIRASPGVNKSKNAMMCSNLPSKSLLSMFRWTRSHGINYTLFWNFRCVVGKSNRRKVSASFYYLRGSAYYVKGYGRGLIARLLLDVVWLHLVTQRPTQFRKSLLFSPIFILSPRISQQLWENMSFQKNRALPACLG